MTREEKIRALAELAQLRRQKAAARLARAQATLRPLEEAADALRGGDRSNATSVADAVAADRWMQWRGRKLRELTLRIARLETVMQPEREALARATARSDVLKRLREK
ncbi:hypothetical protein [Jannaschia marina]|uniref:hypothetical protein n=1 Tax=Jannaschia marina TaxID=2741674 RepID=UPI0015C9A62B|nr:hypothetical protein [Jannaschia marina]